MLSLEDRLKLIAHELGNFPTEEILEQIPSWEELLEQIIAQHGSLDVLRDEIGRDYFKEHETKFPSHRQLNTIATILEKKRVIIGDEPGTRKTAPAALAKYAIEQFTLDGQKLKTLVICPGYIISNWANKIEEYTTDDPNIVIINSDNKNFAIEQATRPDVDYILISYDMIFRSLGLDFKDKETQQEVVNKTEQLLQSHDRDQLYRALFNFKYMKKPERYSDKPIEEIARRVAIEQLKAEAATIIDRLKDIFISEREKGKPYYVIIDEFHNAKNPESMTSKAIKKIALKANFLAMLSGTKTPDNLNDIANIAAILDPLHYKTADHFKIQYNGDPELIALFYQRWEKKPVLKSEDIGSIPQLLEPEIITFELSDVEKEVYLQIVNNRDVKGKEKLLMLRHAVMDQRLLHPDRYPGTERMRQKLRNCFEDRQDLLTALETLEPTRYQKLEELVERIVAQGEKAIIYTKYTTNITEEIEQRLLDKGLGVCKVDESTSLKTKDIILTAEEVDELKQAKLFSGQKYRTDLSKKEREYLGLQYSPLTLFSERDKQILDFQTNPDKQIMLTTVGTLREGRDLHAASHVIFLDRDYSPGIEWQCIKRAHRSGQQKDVHRYYFEAVGTIDIGIRNHINKKRIAIMKAEMGGELTKKQRKLFQRLAPERDEEIAQHMLPPPHLIARNMAGTLIGKGADYIDKWLDVGQNAELFAQAYNADWEFSYSAQTARLLEQLANKLEEEKHLESIIDLGCGPAAFSRQTKRAVTCLDINKFQLNIGKEVCEQLGIENEYVKAPMHDMPFINNDSFNLVVCSLALHYGCLEDGEREKVIREINRILKKDGYFLLALPKNIVNEDGNEKLEAGLASLGFEVNKELTGNYIATKAKYKDGTPKRKSNFEVYILAAQKTSDCLEATCNEDAFILNTDYNFSDPKKNAVLTLPPRLSGETGEICTEFYNKDTDKTLAARAYKAKPKAHTTKEDLSAAYSVLNDIISGQDVTREEITSALKKLQEVMKKNEEK